MVLMIWNISFQEYSTHQNDAVAVKIPMNISKCSRKHFNRSQAVASILITAVHVMCADQLYVCMCTMIVCEYVSVRFMCVCVLCVCVLCICV